MNSYTFVVFKMDGNFETFATEHEAVVYARQSNGMIHKIPNAYLSQRCEIMKNTLSRGYPPYVPGL